MDINYLLSREQISLMKARTAACPEARAAHAGLARAYGQALGRSAFPHRDVDARVPRRPSGSRPSDDA
ncbi:hypothetical protein FHT00_001111 [Sphingomonas insulae]|nr:hypothetical protein [Sphingomonas insulae]NIJ29178.1 hypothetical protein [Sphingomonas insulae]